MSPMHPLPQALRDDTYLCDIFFLVHGWWVQGPLLLCLNQLMPKPACTLPLAQTQSFI